ncbi:MAG TPA: hypothetical protein VH560_19665 [Polyangia bacterium]|nr:hypothetical protein [Polyangia bacterium]
MPGLRDRSPSCCTMILPDSLRAAPAAVQPYLVARDTFLPRLYAQQAGYWKSNGDGLDIYAQTNPFRFIIYSEMAARGLAPVAAPSKGR